MGGGGSGSDLSIGPSSHLLICGRTMQPIIAWQCLWRVWPCMEHVCRPADPPTLGISLLLPQGSCPAARDRNSASTKYIDLCIIGIYLFHDVWANRKLDRVAPLVADRLLAQFTTDTDKHLLKFLFKLLKVTHSSWTIWLPKTTTCDHDQKSNLLILGQ